MDDQEALNLLITRAAAIVGSEYKLSKLLGIPQSHISAWKTGTRTCMPADRARLAGFAREDAVQELVRATLAATAGTLRGDQLRTVLGKWSHQTGAALHTVLLAMGSAIFGTLTLNSDVLRCILC